MQRRYRARLAKLQNQQAQARNTLGVKPEYGAPVLMPPSDRLSGALGIMSQIAGIVSGFKELGAANNTLMAPDYITNPIPTLPNGMTDWSQALTIGP